MNRFVRGLVVAAVWLAVLMVGGWFIGRVSWLPSVPILRAYCAGMLTAVAAHLAGRAVKRWRGPK